MASLSFLTRRLIDDAAICLLFFSFQVYGSADETDKQVWIEHYTAHNAAVMATIPASQLLVIDVTKGEGWNKLCPFLSRADGPCSAGVSL